MLAAAILLAALSARAADDDYNHKAPAPSASDARSSAAQRQETLSELWQRRILPPDSSRWQPEDIALLERLRRAESADAVRMLRRRLHGLKDLAVEYRPVGGAVTEWRLTKEGFTRYLFLRSQDALDYFDGKDIPAKTAFQLTDLDGKKLFDKSGLLTEAGEAVYDRAQDGLEARWKLPSGEIAGSRRRPHESGKTP
jgi:hypothetical protein